MKKKTAILVFVCGDYGLEKGLKMKTDLRQLLLNPQSLLRTSCENYDRLFLEFQFTVFLSSLEWGMFASPLYLVLISFEYFILDLSDYFQRFFYSVQIN